MAEYIEREAFIKHLRKDPLFKLVERYGITHAIESFPSADVAPVRHGRWVEVEVDKDDDGIPTLIMAGCDQCHSVSWTATPFCGYCGAKMDGGEI